jgi:hypothetical protein
VKYAGELNVHWSLTRWRVGSARSAWRAGTANVGRTPEHANAILVTRIKGKAQIAERVSWVTWVRMWSHWSVRMCGIRCVGEEEVIPCVLGLAVYDF